MKGAQILLAAIAGGSLVGAVLHSDGYAFLSFLACGAVIILELTEYFNKPLK